MTDSYAMDDPEIREQAIVLLMAAAKTTPEARALERIALRANFLWLCACEAANYPSRELCSSCRKPRIAETGGG